MGTNLGRLSAEDKQRVIDLLDADDAAEQIVDALSAKQTHGSALFVELFQVSPDPLLIIDGASGQILNANHEACNLYQYSLDEFQSMDAVELSGELEASQLSTKRIRSIAGGLLHIPVRLHRKKTGELVQVEITARNCSSHGRPIVLAAIRDITAQRRTQQELQDAQARLLSIIDATESGTWEWNVQTGETVFNELWAGQLGYSLDELAPLTIATLRILTHPSDLGELWAELERHFAGETEFFDREIRMRHKEGQWVWIHTRGRLVSRTQDGKPLLMLGTHSEISRRKEADGFAAMRTTALELMTKGAPLAEVLTAIARGVEDLRPPTLCSITPLDKAGQAFQKSIAPSLSLAYSDGIEGLLIGPTVGSCGRAAATKQQVISVDIHEDPNWADYLSIAKAEGVRSCWSQPIISSTGAALGAFALYHRLPRTPDKHEIELIEHCAQLASIAIERDLAATELVESEARFRSFFEHNNSVMLLLSPFTGEIVSANDAALRFYGYPGRSLIGMSVKELNMIGPQAVSNVLQAARDGEAKTYLFPHRLASGEVRDVEVHATPIQSGGEMLLFAIIHDLSSRRLTEESLAELAVRNQTLLQAASDGIHVLDEEGNVVEANEAFCNMLGYSREEILTLNAADWDAQWDKEAILVKIQQLIENPIPFETVHRRKDGSLRDVEITTVGLQLNGVTYLYNSARDITDRKRAEEAREELLERLQKITDLVPGVVYQYRMLPNGHSYFPYVSEAITDMARTTPEELAQSAEPILSIIHPDDVDRVKRSLNSSAQDLTPWSEEYRVQFSDGTERWHFASAMPSREAEGSTLWYGFLADVTQRHREGEARKRLEAQLQQAQKLEALGVLVAGVAHNINNVLAAIMGTASLQEKFTQDSEDLEAFQTITTACRRGRDVVNSLVQFSRPSIATHTTVDVNGLLREVNSLLRSSVRANITIVEQLSDEPQWIQGDPGSMSNSFMNLCINAIDAMPNGGRLTIRTRSLRDHVAIDFEDTGEGMTPEILARIMDPFFTTKPVGKGSGLGLSMTHGVVKAHGGLLEVRSAVGDGTTFTISLPTIEPAECPISVEVKSVTPKNVLLVDDDDDVLLLVSRMLRASGFKVQPVTGGEAALAALAGGASPDLVILDQNMPRMTGTETLVKLRQTHADLPVLISSGQPDIADWNCFKSPNVALISKPFDVDELMTKLAAMENIEARQTA